MLVVAATTAARAPERPVEAMRPCHAPTGRPRNRLAKAPTMITAEAIVEVGAPIFAKHGRVKAHATTQVASVLVGHRPHIRERACRAIRHRNRHIPEHPDAGVQVVPPVGPLAHVGGEQVVLAVLRHGILALAEDDPLIAPVGEVVHRRTPGDVVPNAVGRCPCLVVAAVHVHAVTKDVWLTIGHVPS